MLYKFKPGIYGNVKTSLHLWDANALDGGAKVMIRVWFGINIYLANPKMCLNEEIKNSIHLLIEHGLFEV